MPTRRLVSTWLLVAGLAVILAGCGDYEKNMKAAQEKVEKFDEENKHVEEALDLKLLDKDRKEYQVNEVFVRARAAFLGQRRGALGPGMYRYVRPQGTNTGLFLEMQAAVAPMDQKDFTEAVMKAAAPYLGNPVNRKVTRQMPVGDALQLDMFENPQTGYALFFGQRGGYQFALGYLPDKSRSGPTTKGMEYSLDSLAVGGDADKSRKAWNRMINLRRMNPNYKP